MGFRGTPAKEWDQRQKGYDVLLHVQPLHSLRSSGLGFFIGFYKEGLFLLGLFFWGGGGGGRVFFFGGGGGLFLGFS